MSEQIILKNMQFYAFHGIRDTEKYEGQLFQMDLILHADLKRAAAKDDLKATINYEEVYQTIEEEVRNNKYHLLEALGEAIAKKIKAKYPRVSQVEVTVRKPKVSMHAILDYVAVKVVR